MPLAARYRAISNYQVISFLSIIGLFEMARRIISRSRGTGGDPALGLLIGKLLITM
jgi:hypothetical protein